MVSYRLQVVKVHIRNFIMQSTGKSTVVPDHKQELGKGLEHKILKQAGLK